MCVWVDAREGFRLKIIIFLIKILLHKNIEIIYCFKMSIIENLVRAFELAAHHKSDLLKNYSIEKQMFAIKNEAKHKPA